MEWVGVHLPTNRDAVPSQEWRHREQGHTPCFPFIHTCTPQLSLKPLTECAALEVSKATWTLLLIAKVRTQPNLNCISHGGKQQFTAFLSSDACFTAPHHSHRTSLCRFKCLVAPITSYHIKQLKSPSVSSLLNTCFSERDYIKFMNVCKCRLVMPH